MIEEKLQLRKHIKEIKKTFSTNELAHKSDKIIQNLLSLNLFREKDIVLSYWSLPDEVHTINLNQLLFKQGKTILLPSVVRDDLQIRYFEGIEQMVAMPPFGIKESVGKVFEDLMKIQIILVPGVAFDRKLRRMGRGKGYYDRFLLKTKGIKIGLCFDFQLFEDIPHTDTDILMDMIVSENEVIA